MQKLYSRKEKSKSSFDHFDILNLRFLENLASEWSLDFNSVIAIKIFTNKSSK